MARSPFFPLLASLLLIPSVTALNTTSLNTTQVSLSATGTPFEIWAMLFLLSFVFLFLSLWPGTAIHDLWAVLAFLFSISSAALSFSIQFHTTYTEAINDTVYVVPVETVYNTGYLPTIAWMIALVSVVNVFRAIWTDYLRPLRDDRITAKGGLPPLR